jgi:hypothetical protein
VIKSKTYACELFFFGAGGHPAAERLRFVISYFPAA